MMETHIRRVTQIVTGAQGLGEMILREIAHPKPRVPEMKRRTTRRFSEWSEGRSVGEIERQDERITCTLEIGATLPATTGALILRDVPYLRCESGRMPFEAERLPGGALALNVPQTLDPEKIERIANQIVATFVLRRGQWAEARPRQSHTHRRPLSFGHGCP